MTDTAIPLPDPEPGSLHADLERAAAAWTALGRALADAFRPLVDGITRAATTFREALGETWDAWLAMPPERREAQRVLDAALDDAEAILERDLDDLREELTGWVARAAYRARLWAACMPGVTEDEVMARATLALDSRYRMAATREQAATIAAGFLQGWTERRH